MKKIRLIPCAPIWLIFAKTVRYIMRINPPPSPREANIPVKNAIIVAIKIWLKAHPPYFISILKAAIIITTPKIRLSRLFGIFFRNIAPTIAPTRPPGI